MGTPCRHPAIGATDDTIVARPGDMYATRHNPFVYFHSIIDSPTCAQNVVDLDRARDRPEVGRDDAEPRRSSRRTCVTTGTTRRASTASPAASSRPTASSPREVPKILASPAYKADGMLVITLDEAVIADAPACCHTPPSPNAAKPGLSGPGGGRIGTLLCRRGCRPGRPTPRRTTTTRCCAASRTCSGSQHLGFAGAPGLTCFGKDVYDGFVAARSQLIFCKALPANRETVPRAQCGGTAGCESDICSRTPAIYLHCSTRRCARVTGW